MTKNSPLDPDQETKEFAGEQSPSGLAAEAFKRLVYMCVPPKTYGQERLGRAAYRRFIATIWLVTPEVFEGATQEEMAERCGLTVRAFRKNCAAVRAAIDARKRQ